MRKDPTNSLPKRVYLHHGSFYLITKENKRINLGRDKESMAKNYEAATGIVLKRLLDEGVHTELLRRTKGRAKRSSIAFALTKADVLNMFFRAMGRCELTGIAFDLDIAGEFRKRRRPWAPSIDRIENNKGYSPDNCRLVCIAVNIALSEFGEEVLYKIASNLRNKR